MNKSDLEYLLERNEVSGLDDTDLADFIEKNLIDATEQSEFKKRRISVAGCFTGKWEATDANERFLNKTFRRWNALIDSQCKAFGFTPLKSPIFIES